MDKLKRHCPCDWRCEIFWNLSRVSKILYVSNRVLSLVVSPLFLLENIFYLLIFLLTCIYRLLLTCFCRRWAKGRKEDCYKQKSIFFCLKVDVLCVVGLLGNAFTLAFLLFIYEHAWINLTDESSEFHKLCEKIHDYFNFEVDYSDLSLLLFFIFRVVLLMLERV